MVEEKMRIPIAQVLGNILYLLRLKMEEAYKKLVRLEMVRRSLRMRADIRIMKHLVTWPTSKCYMLGVLSISSSKKACVAYTPTVMALLSKLGDEDHKLSGVGANVMAASGPLPLIILFGLSRLVFRYLFLLLNQRRNG
ncbi:unnamed protein product [Brassica rapa subsp. narinosa]